MAPHAVVFQAVGSEIVDAIDYLALLCMNKARKLLQESSTSVQDIAYACGYEDAKYFSRLFHKLEGVGPAEFRSLHKRT